MRISVAANSSCFEDRRWNRTDDRPSGAGLRGALVVDEEKGEEHEVGDREGNSRYHVDRLRHSDWMRRLLLPQLEQKRLRVTEDYFLLPLLLRPEMLWNLESFGRTVGRAEWMSYLQLGKIIFYIGCIT